MAREAGRSPECDFLPRLENIASLVRNIPMKFEAKESRVGIRARYDHTKRNMQWIRLCSERYLQPYEND